MELFYQFFLVLALGATIGHVLSNEYETADYLKREHSLTKPYQGENWWLNFIACRKLNTDSPLSSVGAGMNVPYWDFLGNTMVTNNFVRLVSYLEYCTVDNKSIMCICTH